MSTFKIQAINRHRLETDGKGVTTLVGLYGCPLDCKYCINKDMIKSNQFNEVTPEELWNKLKLDYCYFVATDGGITFGGGEPLLQSKQIKELKEILPNNIKINVETSLNVDSENLKDVMHIVDEFIIDVKSAIHNVYKEYTGVSNSKVLKNLKILCNDDLQHKCKIRVPNIPNFTTKNDIINTINIISNLGFKNIDTFDYIITKGD